MKINIKYMLMVSASAVLACASSAAMAQTWPSQTIRFVTGFPPGSGADTVTRYVAEQIKKISNASIVVENRVGAAGSLALMTVARAKPDGYTVLMGTATATASAMSLFKNPPVDVGKAIRIGGTISRQGFMIVVDKTSPYKTLAELTAAMKSKGGKASYGAAAPSGIVLGEVYKSFAGTAALLVRFRTSTDALKEMASGNLDYASIDPQIALAQKNQGNIRVLAISTGERLKATPDIPTMKESGFKDFDQTGWWAMMVPAATPDAVVKVMDGWMKKMSESPEAKKFFNASGGDPFYLPADQAQKKFLQEIDNWGRYMGIAKIEKQ